MIDRALLERGETLATVDAVTYVAVRLVFACDEDTAPELYCGLDDWPSTHAARLAARDKEIAELEAVLSRQAAESLKQFQRASAAEARIKELEAQLAQLPHQNQAEQFRAQESYVRGDPPEPPDEDLVCPDCDKGGWKSAKSLQMHRQRAHQGMVAVRTDLIVPPLQFVEELGWRCKAKGCMGAHARDMHDPDFCTLHAAPRTNGHEIPA